MAFTSPVPLPAPGNMYNICIVDHGLVMATVFILNFSSATLKCATVSYAYFRNSLMFNKNKAKQQSIASPHEQIVYL